MICETITSSLIYDYKQNYITNAILEEKIDLILREKQKSIFNNLIGDDDINEKKILFILKKIAMHSIKGSCLYTSFTDSNIEIIYNIPMHF